MTSLTPSGVTEGMTVTNMKGTTPSQLFNREQNCQ